MKLVGQERPHEHVLAEGHDLELKGAVPGGEGQRGGEGGGGGCRLRNRRGGKCRGMHSREVASRSLFREEEV